MVTSTQKIQQGRSSVIRYLYQRMTSYFQDHVLPVQANRAVKLTPFWPGPPTRWPGSQQLKAPSDCETLHMRSLASSTAYTKLPDAMVVADLVEAVPFPSNPHMQLPAVHQLTDIQRAEKLHQPPLLANQKLSELLVEMLLLYPRGQENNAFFNCLFLSKLPRELCILLSNADMRDRQVLGARGRLLCHPQQQQAGPRHWWQRLSRSRKERKVSAVQCTKVHPGARDSQRCRGSPSEVEAASSGQRRSPDTVEAVAGASR
jgi:hypothetical protein